MKSVGSGSRRLSPLASLRTRLSDVAATDACEELGVEQVIGELKPSLSQ